MSHIFISYSRKDLDFAEKIVDALAANNLDTWIDWKSIPKGEDWEQEIYRGIEEADAFLFLLSPDSVVSEMCNKEITHAVNNGKRILPIFISSVKNKEVYNVTEKFLKIEAKEEINRRNFIFCRKEMDDFDDVIGEIRKTIHTDYEWLKYHTRLQVKALEWERTKDNSRLLRGKELQEAEQYFAEIDSREDPQPTSLQLRFIFSGRAEEDYQQRRTRRLLASGIVVALTLACIATYFGITARRNEKIQLAKTVAAKAQTFVEQDPQRSILLALASQSIFSTEEAQDVLSSVPFAYPKSTITIAEYASRINTVSWNHNGSLVAIGADENTVIIWNVASDRLLTKFTAEVSGITSTSWSPDDSMLVTGGREIIVWDVATGEIINRLIFYPPWISNILKLHQQLGITPSQEDYESYRASALREDVDWRAEWNPSGDGIVIYSPKSSPKMWLWDITGNTTVELVDEQSKSGAVPCVTWSPDGKKLASSGYDGNIVIWDTEIHLPTRTIPASDTVGSGTFCVAWSPDGSMLAVSEEASILIWSTTDGTLLKRLAGVESAVFHISWHPTLNLLASGGFDDSVIVWDVSEGKPAMKLNEPTQSVTYLSWNPDGTKLASGGADSLITIWDFASHETSINYGGHPSGAWSAAWSSDGALLASGGADDTIIIWDTTTHLPISTLSVHDSIVSTVSWSPDNLQLVSGSTNGKIIIWDVMAKQSLVEFSTTTSVLKVAWSSNGKYVASLGRGVLTVWDVSNGQAKRLNADYPESVWGLAWDPSGTELALGQADGSITIWDVGVQTISKKILIEDESIIDDVAWSADGSKIAARGRSNDKVVILDTTNWEISLEITVNSISELNTSLSWSPDAKNLAITKKDGLIIWDIPNDKLLATYTGKTGKINDIAWSPDNSYIALATNLQGVVAMSTIYIDPPCKWVSRNLTEVEWDTYVSSNTPYQVLCPDRPVPKIIK